LPAIVGHVGKAHAMLATRPDGAGTDLLIAQLLADGLFRFISALSEQVSGIQKFHMVVINKNVHPIVALVVNDDAIPTSAF